MSKEIAAIIALLGFSHVFAGTIGGADQSYDFAGLYGGLGTGLTVLYDRDNHSTTLNSPLIHNSAQTRASNASILFEGHLGYGQFIKSGTYLGAKASVYESPLNALYNNTNMIASGNLLIANNNSNQITIKPIYNIDLVLGYEVYPHLLPFIEGGVSFANVLSNDIQHNVESNSINNTNLPYTMTLNSNGYKTGYNVGLGTSYQFNKNWFVSGELVYNYLGKQAATSTVNLPTAISTQTVSTNRMFQLASLFISASYLFPTS